MMILTLISLYVTFAMLAVIYYDVTRYIIPNWLVGSLLVLYPVAAWMAPGSMNWMDVAGMAIVFALGYALFAMKWMGAGDIKLITVCALWVGFEKLLDYVFLMALLGGAFAALLWTARKILPHAVSHGRQLPRILREGEPVPYGVAIALAMLWITWH